MTRARAAWNATGLGLRLAGWVGLCTFVSLSLFVTVTYLVVRDERSEGDHQTPQQAARDTGIEIGQAVLVVGPIVLVIATLGTLAITRRVLGPLENVVQSAARIGTGTLDRRLPLPRADDEVRTVVVAFNELVARLEAGYQRLDRFATEASHELRTPLSVMGAELEIMLRAPRSQQDWARSARMCLEEVHHLTQLVEALLALGRAQGPAAGASTDLQDVVEHVLHALAAPASARAITLRSQLDPGQRSMVSGHRSSLISVLLNLVNNALRYSPAGSDVVVTLRQAPDAILVLVDDAGPGVEPNEAERIFEPFARGSAARHLERLAPEQSAGCGLGLAISRKILELHAATISVARSPAGGARFELAFPIGGAPVVMAGVGAARRT